MQPGDFCHYVSFAHGKLVQFVDSRKDLTAQSYRLFVEHAYNQFSTHEAFHHTARVRANARDLDAARAFHASTKLDGHMWIGSQDKVVHVPKDKADDVEMTAGDDVEEAEDDLPRLSTGG